MYLALDPEFSMGADGFPGRRIGTMQAREVNNAIAALECLMARRNLPPKVLIVHQFTTGMLPDKESIWSTDKVDVVLDMDGFGFPELKLNTYRAVLRQRPLRYTGFKLFYIQDTGLLQPAQVLALSPFTLGDHLSIAALQCAAMRTLVSSSRALAPAPLRSAAPCRAVRSHRRLVRRRDSARADAGARARARARRVAARPRDDQVARLQQRQDVGRLGERGTGARHVPVRRARAAALARRRAGLRVIVQIYTDAAPEWLGRRYPDSSFVTDQGARIGSQASPGYCLDHAGVRADMMAFIGAVRRAPPTHASFYGVDVWSEPHIVNWVWFNTPVEFCYCPHTQARFREWLKAKYRTLEALNAAWYRTFSSWDQPEAPRYGTILSYTRLHRLEDVRRRRSCART